MSDGGEGVDYVLPVTANSVVKAGMHGRSNAIENRKPKEAALALEMMAFGEPLKEIEKRTGLGISVLSGLRARHMEALEDRRKHLSADAVEIAEGLRLLQREKIRMLAEDPEQLAKTNIRDLTLPWAIAHTKVFEAMGENKVVVEHKSGAPSLEDAMKAIKEARDSLKKTSIDVTPKDDGVVDV